MSKLTDQEKAAQEIRDNAKYNAIIQEAMKRYNERPDITKIGADQMQHVEEKLRANLLATLKQLDKDGRLTSDTTHKNKDREYVINNLAERLELDGGKKVGGGYTIKEEKLKESVVPNLAQSLDPGYQFLHSYTRGFVIDYSDGSKQALPNEEKDRFFQKILDTVGAELKRYKPEYVANVDVQKNVKESINRVFQEDQTKSLLRGGKNSVEIKHFEAAAKEIAQKHIVSHALFTDGKDFKAALPNNSKTAGKEVGRR